MDRIPFKAAGGIYGSYLGLLLCFIILAAQIYVAIDVGPPPEGEDPPTPGERADNFFKQVLALPVVLVFWACGYLWKRTGWLRTDQIDLDTGLREHDWDEINAYRAKIAALPKWRRVLHSVF